MSTAGFPGPAWGLSLDTTLTDLETAWHERETEAAAISAAGHPMMSIALRLYSLEIRLKAMICKKLGLNYLPRHCKTHDLNELILFTGLSPELEDPANAAIRKSWNFLTRFSKDRLNNLRYLPASTLTVSNLGELLVALDGPTQGVWTWLSRHP
jgi:hypothetical protein